MGPRPHDEKGLLRSHDAAAHHWQFRPVMIWGPPDQILDLPLHLGISFLNPSNTEHVTATRLEKIHRPHPCAVPGNGLF